MKNHAYEIGQNYIIRTVAMIYTGKLVAVYEHELVIEDAAWIAETSRWHKTLLTGELNEIEPYPDGQVIVARGGIIDVAKWSHALPRVAK